MSDGWLFTRENGDTLALDVDVPGESPYVVSAFSPYLTADWRVNDQPVPWGETGALDVEGGRPMTVGIQFKAWPDAAAVTDAMETLEAFFQASAEDIFCQWTVDGRTRGRYVRSRGLNDTTDSTQHFLQEVQLNLRALDPRTYGEPVTVTIGNSPTTVPIGGQRPTQNWLVSVDGPAVAALFEGTLQSGETFLVQISSPGFLPLLTGETLEFDGRNDEVRIIGTTGIVRWPNGAPTDGGGRPAVLWPLGPGDCPCQFIDSSDLSVTATLTVFPAF